MLPDIGKPGSEYSDFRNRLDEAIDGARGHHHGTVLGAFVIGFADFQMLRMAVEHHSPYLWSLDDGTPSGEAHFMGLHFIECPTVEKGIMPIRLKA